MYSNLPRCIRISCTSATTENFSSLFRHRFHHRAFSIHHSIHHLLSRRAKSTTSHQQRYSPGAEMDDNKGDVLFENGANYEVPEQISQEKQMEMANEWLNMNDGSIPVYKDNTILVNTMQRPNYRNMVTTDPSHCILM